MIHIRGKILGVLIAVIAIGVAVAVPAFASAEGEVAPEAPPAAETTPEAPSSPEMELFDESCQTAHVCAWPSTNYNGAKFERACKGVGTTYHPGFIVESLKTRCGNPIKALGGLSNACFQPVTNHPTVPGIFSEFRIVASC